MKRKRDRLFILLGVLVFILILQANLQIINGNTDRYSVERVLTEIAPFEFTLTNSTVVNIQNYIDKPILLGWSASWCSICRSNHDTINDIYEEYKTKVNFLSISYFNSGDDLDDVKQMKGSFEWFFGLDHTNYAQTADVQNADTWILYPNLTITMSWDYSFVSENSLKSELDQILVEPNTTGETSSSSTSQLEEELWVLDLLLQNPLFLGFFGVMGVIVFVILIVRVRR